MNICSYIQLTKKDACQVHINYVPPPPLPTGGQNLNLSHNEVLIRTEDARIQNKRKVKHNLCITDRHTDRPIDRPTDRHCGL